MPHCNSDAPASPQPGRYSYPLMLAVLAALGAALIVSTAALLRQPSPPCAVVDANGNCAAPVRQ